MRRRAVTKGARRPGRPAHPITPAELVALALPVFAERGPDGVSMSEIAELAKIRKASVYHHFESKEALYTAVMDDSVLGLFELIAAANLEEGSFADRLDRLGSLVIDALAARPQTARLLMRELIGHGPYLAARGTDRVKETLGVTAAFLEAGMDAGEFVREDPNQLALTIAGVHLFPFAAAEAAGALLGASLLVPPGLESRRTAVIAQVRRLCVR